MRFDVDLLHSSTLVFLFQIKFEFWFLFTVICLSVWLASCVLNTRLYRPMLDDMMLMLSSCSI